MKRGQVSIFIIFGILLLLIMGIVFYLYFSDAEAEVDRLTRESLVSSIPSDFLPFYRFAEACVDDVLDQGIRLASSKGGIIYPEEAGLVFSYEFPTLFDGVSLFPRSSFGVAYWNYMFGSEQCIGGCERFLGHIALEGDSTASFQRQIELYVERNLPTCLNRALLLNQVDISFTELGSPIAEVIITEEEVFVDVEYPLFLEKNDMTFQIPVLLGESDIPLRKFYDDALLLTAILNEFTALEDATIQWISLYSAMRNDALPPMSGSSSDPGVFPFWNYFDVKEQLRTILSSQIPLFSVVTSNNFNPIFAPDDSDFIALKDQFYKMYEVPAPFHFDSYDVFFQYPHTDFYLQLNDGDFFIAPESLTLGFFPWFSITRLRTMYHVSYPVLITLSDASLRDFDFTFAYEVNVRNNVPMSSDYVPFDYDAFEDVVLGQTFMCEPDQRTSELVSFTLVDGKTGLGLSDVSLLFECGAEACILGKTGSDGSFNEALPVCHNARIDFIESGYERLGLRLSPSIRTPLDFGNIHLEPYRTINVTLENVYIHPRSKEFQGVLPLRQNEEAIIMLQRVLPENDIFFREDLPLFAAVSYENPVTEVTLLPGVYAGEIIGFVREQFIIPPDTRCEGNFLYEFCMDMPDSYLPIEVFMTSGMSFNESSSYLRLPKSLIDTSEIIVFRQLFQDIYGLSQSTKLLFEDIEVMGNDPYLQSRFRDELRVRFN